MQGVLTFAIELWNFRSPRGLPSPHFGSVSFILTLSQSRVATIFVMFFNLHWVCLRSYVRPSVGAWSFVHLAILCFHLALDVFSFVLWTKLGLPHPLVLSLTHCIYSQLWNPMGIHLLHYAHGGKRTCYLGCFCVHCEKCKVSHLAKANPCSYVAFSSIFSLVGWHCSINWWHLHIDRCRHH